MNLRVKYGKENEPKALHVVDQPGTRVVDIVQARECNRGWQELIERRDRGSSTIQVFRVTCDTPCVEVGFQDL